ncbi:MAG: Ig-like domain-containing protein, partial [Anaerolineales bacterium]|nr:Ig-like domain-containing protein [Anaerolineales bacterium]
MLEHQIHSPLKWLVFAILLAVTLLAGLLGLGQSALAAPEVSVLGPGDIAIIGFNYDTPDGFAFVTLVDLDTGTEIRFTDSGWTAADAFRCCEGAYKYTAPAAIAAGTVITFPSADFTVDNDAIVGTNGLALSTSGDQILAFQGASDTPTFVYALNSEGTGWQADATSSNTSALPLGLTDETSAVALIEIDNAVYTGTTTGTRDALLAAISNPANWAGSDVDLQVMPTDPFTVLSPSADLQMSKTAVPDTNVIYHSLVTYTVVLANNGSVTDTAVYVTDTLPVSTTFASWVEQPAGAAVIADELTWNGEVAPSTAVTFTFIVTHTGDYGDVVENTAVYSGTSGSGSNATTFTVQSLTGDITFVYHDLEDVVLPGEAVYLAGDFNGWNPTALLLTADAANDVFTATVPALSAGTHEYKYIVDSGGSQWDWLNTNNHSYTVGGTATVNDYRNVTVGWANLNGPSTTTTDMDTATENIYGQLYINNVTNPSGEGRGLKAEVGFGTETDPGNWEWFPMSFNTQLGNNDEFTGVMTPTIPGVYSYTTRYDGNWGVGNPNATWTYGDLNGIPFELAQTGVMTVNIVTVPIATARAGSNGETFAISGTVTYLPGTYNFAGWAIQDATGGIPIYDTSLVPTLNYGDVVQVVGVRGAYSGEEQLGSLSYYNNLGAGPEVTPISYTTSALDAGNGEGWIVELEGTISDLTGCSGNYDFLVDDGSGAVTVYVDADTGVNVCNLGAADGELIHVVGFATQYNTLNEIKPRRLSDVQVLLDAPVVLNTSPADGATGVLTDTLITIDFSEPVSVTTSWFDINCAISGNVTGDVTSGPAASYTITPTTPFVNGEICFVNVLADQVTGVDSGAPMAGDYAFSFTVGTFDPGVCGDPATPIHFVQGAGLESPLVGSSVVVEGVVVGDYQSTLNGYYIQEENADFDGDTMTSEGIFVYNSTAVNEGDVVRVQGSVSEYRGLTELGSATVSVCGTDTVTPTVVTLPLAEADDWEYYEGMLIAINDELTVTNSYYLGRFGQVRLSIGGRLPQPTNVVLPGQDALDLQDLNNRSGVTIDDANPAQNADPIVYPDPQLTFTNTLRGGDVVSGGIVGVVDHYNNDSSDDYRVFPTEPVVFDHANARTAVPEDTNSMIQVASFNVLN